MEEKKTEKNWQCLQCTTINNEHMPHCEVCGLSKASKPHKNDTNPYVDDALINAQALYSPLQNKKYIDQHKITNNNNNDNCWQCKLCTMMNNEFMEQCEQCLVKRDSQENVKSFNQLTNVLKSNANIDKYMNAQQIRRLNDDIALQFEQESKMNIKLPICKCGQEMEIKTAKQCYHGVSHYKYAICDICDNKMPDDDIVYHCPRKQLTDIHPDGFDICLLCRQKYIHRLRYFVALIICSPIHSHDRFILKSMFEKLGFHQIICLKEEELTKISVESKLNKLLPKNNENVNQFTVICYSGFGAWIDDNYYFALNDKNPETWISAEFINKQCQPTIYNGNKDGNNDNDNSWNKTYYRHNSLLLINSCHSNDASDDIMESKRISNALLAHQKSNECESMLVIASSHKKKKHDKTYGMSPFIKGFSNFVHLFLDLQQNNLSLYEHQINVSPLIPLKLFKYLKNCYDENKNNISMERIGENICSSIKISLPKKALILQRKMRNAFGIFGEVTGASHEYHIIFDPNTGRKLRTEMLNQSIDKIVKNPLKNIKIVSKFFNSNDEENCDDEKAKVYETYYLDPINFPDLQSVKKVIDFVKQQFDFKAYHLGYRNCQTYGSVLTSRLYGIPIEYVRIKDKYLMKQINKYLYMFGA